MFCLWFNGTFRIHYRAHRFSSEVSEFYAAEPAGST
jgi:hypothetical protein